MNYNLWSYIIYLSITFYITVIVGRNLHRNGIHFIRTVFIDRDKSDVVNNILLTGYYLINLGYLAISITNWSDIKSTEQLLAVLFQKTGFIILLLGILHINNIVVLYIISNTKSINNSLKT